MSEWKKTESQIFKFEKEGDTIEGILLSKEQGKTYGNDVYKIKLENGDIKTVFSTTVMASEMSCVKVGQSVKIVYTGEKENSKTGQEPIKQFDVYFK